MCENFIKLSSSSVESVNRTFSSSTHRSLTVGQVLIPANTCKSTTLYGGYTEVILNDGAQNPIYTGLMNETRTGFDGGSYGFEMLVPEDGFNSSVTEYFMYVEIG